MDVDSASNIRGSRIGVVMISPEWLRLEKSLRLGFYASNNKVEYGALIASLRVVQKLSVEEVEVFSDSKLVVSQIEGSFETKDAHMQQYLKLFRALQATFQKVSMVKIPRSQNSHVDSLATLASSSGKRQSSDSNNFEDSPSRREFDGSKRNSSFPVFDLRTIIAATDNFSAANELGKGGFGSVYKGLLQNRMEIAIKRLSKYSGQGVEEFKNEVALIAKLQHRNLVRILGCCIQGEEKMLVYEYLPNKSLDSFIFDETKRLCLDWGKRFEIICGIARGILYLHQDSRLRIIHRDLKASNILLDNTLNPKISDFGMARIVGGDQIEVNTNRVVGTYGYMSPEYAMQGVFSIKSDVYSFGVLLLEIIAGKKNGTCYHDGLSPYLIEHVWDLWREGKAMEIVDASLGETYPANEVLRCIQIGLLCVQEHARDRPTMLTIVFMLGNDTPLPSPKQPAFISTSTNNIRDMLTSINEVSISEIDGR
ncbi:G-type lectin S-receptor-like serine/threonine-protein kinase At1g11410 [Quercus lobata]|uniref:G-type lectin S-receptor-like serine/threonine-protein kinase At1g11410 n=1 Tax=Quercus lobata TaxID=97700 RepID=UPI001247E929|nr:G-type lectin S-receptor-like serine/threonine-protein kinase At1g11410 [Quercus lobata]